MSESPDAQGDDDTEGAGTPGASDAETDVEALRRQVESEYDFEDFGPADMARMSPEEWDAAFDADSWITGEQLLDRVEADLKQRVADRDVFARLERQDDRILAYSDTGYAIIFGDGSVEGEGTVLRDVKPTVALCSMESYDVPDDPPDGLLPAPEEVPEGSGTLGNLMLQAVAAVQVVAGVVLVGGWLLISLGVVSPPADASVQSLNVIGMLVVGVIFVAIGLLLFTVVANARLSDRFRAEEYRNRLRAVELEPGERPEFLPDPESRGARVDGDTRDDTDGAGPRNSSASHDDTESRSS